MSAYIESIQRQYTKSGLVRYVVIVRHDALGLFQEIRGDDQYTVRAKAEGKARQWDERWARKKAVDAKKASAARQRRAREQKQQYQDAQKREAVEQTAAAEAAWMSLSRVLEDALGRDNRIAWDALKDRTEFAPRQPAPPPAVEPLPPPTAPPEPQLSDAEYTATVGLGGKLLDLFAPGRKASREAQLRALFEEDHAAWIRQIAQQRADYEQYCAHIAQQRMQALALHRTEVAAWEREREAFRSARSAQHAGIDERRARYMRREPEAVQEYCDAVLESSDYEDWCPKTWSLEFDGPTGMLIVEYDLPHIEDLPQLKHVRYVQSRDELVESTWSDGEVKKRYDLVVYQVALRTLHELFTADAAGALATVTFNGHVSSIDPATGHRVNPCILSVQVERGEFAAINLAAVEPKACFKKLKGIGSSRLHSLTPVAPIVQIDTSDARFVDGYEVVSTLDEGENLAAMDWEDFEHLVREVFEREFAASGGEVKVTRASRDGGIDAIAFDPDPIRGGKIVIQAKRYTKTVGVSAVRDLYGALMNEGANKGILVSTATFGPDAYSFAKDKPLTLIDGGGLLHLLQKHGHRARIDLAEARSIRT